MDLIGALPTWVLLSWSVEHCKYVGDEDEDCTGGRLAFCSASGLVHKADVLK